jgi:hypothetical protein
MRPPTKKANSCGKANTTASLRKTPAVKAKTESLTAYQSASHVPWARYIEHGVCAPAATAAWRQQDERSVVALNLVIIISSAVDSSYVPF